MSYTRRRRYSLNIFLFIIISIAFYVDLNAESGFRFSLRKGDIYTYKIDLSFAQKSRFQASSDNTSPGEKFSLDGTISMYETIEVLENEDGEYARIICRYDSLRAELNSEVEGLVSAIKIEAGLDNIKILQNDSLVSSYESDNGGDQTASAFYNRLLFVGESIVMLVYPDGQIINITENKNLWTLARDLIGLPSEGFLEITVPENHIFWDESIPLDRIGDFELKQTPPPLVMKYQLQSDGSKLSFSGNQEIDIFTSRAVLSDLDDELSISIYGLEVSKSGAAVLSPSRGLLEKMNYRIRKNGDLFLQSQNFEKNEFDLHIDFEGEVSYQLLNK